MFEKFTEKAIDLIYEAQNQAKEMKNAYVQPEHLLLAVVKNSKGIPLRFFRASHMTYDALREVVEDKLKFEKSNRTSIPFGEEFKTLLKDVSDLTKKTGNNYVLPEHLLIAILSEEKSYCRRILEKFDFDIENAKNTFFKLVQKRNKNKSKHPELEEDEDKQISKDDVFNEDLAKSILDDAQEKMKNDGREVIGTDYIISAVLKHSDLDISKILLQNSISFDSFDNELKNISSRKSEFNNKLMFTPCAKEVFEESSQIAKELGSSTLKPEHFILALLKLKKGVAFEVFKNIGINEQKLSDEIIKPIEKQMPQALVILKLAKEEARRLGRNVVGTEMILLGIMSEGFGIGYKVLKELGLSLKDLRIVVENLIGYGNEYFDSEIVFTRRAKRVLEVAWQRAKKDNSPRIMSEHLLYAITTEPSSLAMTSLEQSGIDAVEIRQGILKEQKCPKV